MSLRSFVEGRVISRSMRMASEAINAFANSGKTAALIEVLGKRDNHFPEPQDRASADWILWHLISQRCDIFLRTLKSMKPGEELDIQVMIDTLREAFEVADLSNVEFGLNNKIAGVGDPVAQAVARYFVEDVAVYLDLLRHPLIKDIRRLQSLNDIREIIHFIKGKAVEAMPGVIPPDSKSETLRNAGKLLLALGKALHSWAK